MKISLSWLKQYIELRETPDEISNLLTNCGLEVSHITSTLPTKDFFTNLIIGQVTSCTKHPNADRLKLLKVDIGQDKELEIVCGAPNIAVDMKVVIALVGTSIESINGDITHIKNTKIRGVSSAGMVCSEYEIGIGKESDGIMILDTAMSPGTTLESYLATIRDVIFDIELTPNRGDACSHIGVARDLSAVLDRELVYPKVSDLTDTYNKLSINITVDKTEDCCRYSGVILRDVKITESPQWLKEKLHAIGIQSKNIVVDTTNYVMYETGQPLHAYDYDKIEGKHLKVKPSILNEIISTLDNETRTLNSGELVISDDLGALCIAGVIGGQRAAISLETRNIFLESACFLPTSVRKSTKAQNIATDASFRFERGTGRDTIYPLQRAINLIMNVAGGHLASDSIDITTGVHKDHEIIFKYKSLHRICGIEIPQTDVKRILRRLELEIISDNIDNMHLRIPSFKTDIIREIDVIEEILRIYGFEKIISKEPFSIPYLGPSNAFTFSANVRLDICTLLVANGFYEIRTNPITNSSYYKDMEDGNDSKIISIVNPLSQVMDSMRPSLVFSGLEVIISNRNRQQAGDLKLFEFGKIYFENNKNYIENNRLCIWLAGNYANTKWYETKRKSSFHDLSMHVYNILYKLGIKNFNVKDTSNEIFTDGIEFCIESKIIARMGLLRHDLVAKIDLDEIVFFADIDWDAIIENIPEKTIYKPLAKYPTVERDISLLIDKAITFEKIKLTIQSNPSDLIEKIEIIDVYLGKDLPENTKSYSIRLTIQPYDKTLDSREITTLINDIENNLILNLNAKIR